MSVAGLVSGIETLPSLPSIVFRLQGLIGKHDVDFAEVADLIEHDPALTARLLKAANSAFFGVRMRIRTVEQALVLLGVHTVRNLLVVTSLHGTVRRFPVPLGFRLLRFWEHSLTTAVVSKVLSTRVPRLAGDDAFVCGLLHDIGKVAMAAIFPDGRAAVLTPSAFSDRDLERSVFGVDHVEVGVLLAEHWRLPPLVADAVRYHHEPGLGRPVARVVHSADLFSHYLFPGRVESQSFHQIPDYVAEQLAMPREDLEDVAVEARDALVEAHAIATL